MLILETTQGARGAIPGVTRETELERMVVAMEEVFANRGNVLIPSFALADPGDPRAARALDEDGTPEAASRSHRRPRPRVH